MKIVRKMSISSRQATDDLFKLIREYESDTFSASGNGLRNFEIDRIAGELISQIEEHLDGVQLSTILADIRN